MALWPGVLLGILHAVNMIPPAWSIGAGKYGSLLGANVYGMLIVFGGFALGAVLDRVTGRNPEEATATVSVR